MAFTYRQEILRKSIHLSSFWMVLAIACLPRLGAAALFLTGAVCTIITEYLFYKKIDFWGTRLYGKFFSGVLRDNEKNKSFHLSGGAHVFAAAGIVTLLCPATVAMFCVSVLLLCDTMAALIGRRFGTHKLIGHKSWEGTSAFLISGLFLTILFVYFGHLPVLPALIGVLFGCAGDLFNEKGHIDDNLSIPILTAIPFLI